MCQHAIEPYELTDSADEVYSPLFISVPPAAEGSWSQDGFGRCRDVDESDVASVVFGIAGKIVAYTLGVSAVKLVVVVARFDAGELVSAPDPAAPFPIRTELDRVIASNSVSDLVSEVSVSRTESLGQCLWLAQHFGNRAQLATIWQQYWPCHPNATTMSKRHRRDVSLSKTRTFYVIPTCCQCHAHGRRAGLKIRSS